MDEKFYKLYDELYSGYKESQINERTDGWTTRRITANIKPAINTVTEKLDLWPTLRPDARLFLLINFDQMVVAPLLRAFPGAAIPKIELALEHDLTLILKTASKNAKQKEISGHEILSAINSSWKDMELAKGWWGVDG